MVKLEENTKLFYDELNLECNINKLLDIAKKGILLYEPLFNYEKIKYHEYIIDISLMGNQYFVIYTKEQYNGLKSYITFPKSYNKLVVFSLDSWYFNSIPYCKSIIINIFLIEQLFEEQDENIINKLLVDNCNFFLLYLYKFKYISSYVLNLFYIDSIINCINYKFELFEYLYDNNDEYLNYLVIAKVLGLDNEIITNILSSFLSFECKNVQLLDYCSKIIKKYKVKAKSEKFRIPPRFPLRIIENYTDKIYMPNTLYIQCENNYIERFINATLSDNLLKQLSPKIQYTGISEVELNEYGIYGTLCKEKLKLIKKDDDDDDNNIQLVYDDDDKLYKNEINKHKLFNTKDLLIKKYDPQVYNSIFKYKIKYDNYNLELYEIYELFFVKKYLMNYNELNKILSNTEYIVKINYKTENNVEYIIMKFTYIISLIHNEVNSFIIHVLLRYYFKHNIIFKNNSLLLDIDRKINNDKNFLNIFEILSNTPHEIFNKYVDIECNNH